MTAWRFIISTVLSRGRLATCCYTGRRPDWRPTADPTVRTADKSEIKPKREQLAVFARLATTSIVRVEEISAAARHVSTDAQNCRLTASEISAPARKPSARQSVRLGN